LERLPESWLPDDYTMMMAKVIRGWGDGHFYGLIVVCATRSHVVGCPHGMEIMIYYSKKCEGTFE